MNTTVRCISSDGALMITAADTTDMIEKAQQIHKPSAVVTAALGRLLTASSLMGNMLKGEKDSLTIRMNGAGPAGSIIAVSDSAGNTKGCCGNYIVEIPLNSKGKLDVAGAVGTNGSLTVIKDIGLKEPYVGQVPIISGEIAEDLTNYFAVSEQIASVCALGVLVNPDLSVKKAGGFLIQLLPSADDDTIDRLEKCIEGVPPITQMLTDGMTALEICKKVLPDFDLELLDTSHPDYRCTCSKERVENALISTGRQALSEMAEDDETKVTCHFCNREYIFSSEEIKNLIEKATK